MVDGCNRERFVNEKLSLTIISFVQTVQEKGSRNLDDQRCAGISNTAMGGRKAGTFSVSPWVKRGYVVDAQSSASLARK